MHLKQMFNLKVILTWPSAIITSIRRLFIIVFHYFTVTGALFFKQFSLSEAGSARFLVRAHNVAQSKFGFRLLLGKRMTNANARFLLCTM